MDSPTEGRTVWAKLLVPAEHAHLCPHVLCIPCPLLRGTKQASVSRNSGLKGLSVLLRFPHLAHLPLPRP